MPCLQLWEMAQSHAEYDKKEAEAKKIDKAAEAVADVVKDTRKQKVKAERRDGFKLLEGGKKDSGNEARGLTPGPEILKGDFNL